MPTVVDRDEVVGLLDAQFAALLALCAPISEEQWQAPTCLPGWNVHDVLAHLVGTEEMLAGLSAPEVDVSHRDHLRNPIARANEVWVESFRPLPGDELLSRFADVTSRRMAALAAMSQAEFDAPSWTPAGPDETYGRFMRIRHYDCYMHEQDIRAALGEPPRIDVPSIRSSLAEVSTGLGYIVGKRAAMPDGSRVELQLTGPAAATFRVLVDGRARLVEEFASAPTAGLRLSHDLFLRLTGGRDDGRSGALDGIECSGDRRLCERLVANLAFTI